MTMSRKNIRYEIILREELVAAVEEREAVDKINPRVIADALREFMDFQLANYDSRLAKKLSSTFPTAKTIRRFQQEPSASIELLELCGYYIFKAEWPNQRGNYYEEADDTRRAAD